MHYEYEYIIDFTEAEDRYSVHSIIAKALDFPRYYGCSLDALNDLLKEQLLSGSTKITIYGLDRLNRFDTYGKKYLTYLHLSSTRLKTNIPPDFR